MLCNLLELPVGMRYYISELRCCGETRARLYALGFTPGAELALLGRGSNGVQVRVRGTSLALDHGSAANVLCDSAIVRCNT
ncbi:MAG: FeoA domain-containing protein [Deltaproteobacteria bacterium]|jgi:ferrous iron transport protein A|nr:FeoA domain-containing protein [Deltaproteobacteria bacterium]